MRNTYPNDHVCGDGSMTAAENRHRLDLVRATPSLGAAHQGSVVQCRKGHPLSGENVRVEKNGHRHCRICERERSSRRLATARAGAEAHAG